MYRAIILGHSRRYDAETLDRLLKKLELANIRINIQQLTQLKKELDDRRRMEVFAIRRLTQSEIIKRFVMKPYLGMKQEQTENVRMRFEVNG